MSRDMYIARRYTYDGPPATSISVSASRDREDTRVRFDFSTINSCFTMSLVRKELIALQEMLTEILEDWP